MVVPIAYSHNALTGVVTLIVTGFATLEPLAGLIMLNAGILVVCSSTLPTGSFGLVGVAGQSCGQFAVVSPVEQMPFPHVGGGAVARLRTVMRCRFHRPHVERSFPAQPHANTRWFWLLSSVRVQKCVAR